MCLLKRVRTFLLFLDFNKGFQTISAIFQKSRPLSFFGVNLKFQKVTSIMSLFGVTFWLHKFPCSCHFLQTSLPKSDRARTLTFLSGLPNAHFLGLFKPLYENIARNIVETVPKSFLIFPKSLGVSFFSQHFSFIFAVESLSAFLFILSRLSLF